MVTSQIKFRSTTCLSSKYQQNYLGDWFRLYQPRWRSFSCYVHNVLSASEVSRDVMFDGRTNGNILWLFCVAQLRSHDWNFWTVELTVKCSMHIYTILSGSPAGTVKTLKNSNGCICGSEILALYSGAYATACIPQNYVFVDRYNHFKFTIRRRRCWRQQSRWRRRRCRRSRWRRWRRRSNDDGVVRRWRCMVNSYFQTFLESSSRFAVSCLATTVYLYNIIYRLVN